MQLLEQIETKQARIQKRMLSCSSTKKETYQKLFDRLEKSKNILLSQNTACRQVHLAENNRELSQYENPGVITFLQETFDEEEAKLVKEFQRILEEELLPNIERSEDKIKEGYVAVLTALMFLRKSKIDKTIGEVQATSYEKGKTSAVKELRADDVTVVRPATPILDTSLATFERNAISEAFEQDINTKGRNIIMEGLAKGVAAGAIVQALRRDLTKEYEKRVSNIVGTLVGENINRGRRAVFQATLNVVGYIRSEIMDSRTCNVCISLDGRTVLPDDPMAKMDVVHSRCRGIWIPITKQDQMPTNTGIPKSIIDTFDTVGGVPIANSFTQLKKPVAKK